MNNVIIHVGLHKTGTTYLQNVVFPSLKGVDLARGFYTHRRILKYNLGNKLIISDENISGPLLEGRYLEGFEKNLLKIKEIYKDPKIIFGFREHSSWLLSVYKQYLHVGGSEPISEIYNIEGTGILNLEDILIMPKIKFINDHFSEVFVYNQTGLKAREEAFTLALCEFLNIQVVPEIIGGDGKNTNIGVRSKLQVDTLRKLNKIDGKLRSLNSKFSLNSKVFKKLSLIPRNICQYRLKNISSPLFVLPKDIYEHLIHRAQTKLSHRGKPYI